MVSGSQHVTVGLDVESKRYMTRLTAAIDALAKAINNGEKVDKDSISEPVVHRLVEDAPLRVKLSQADLKLLKESFGRD